ncbi:hypothetical protein T06_8227 [Trichinella sp. T6]|nr:hypothetical protein T06_8227 [Trichinella sp. T6]
MESGLRKTSAQCGKTFTVNSNAKSVIGTCVYASNS